MEAARSQMAAIKAGPANAVAESGVRRQRVRIVRRDDDAAVVLLAPIRPGRRGAVVALRHRNDVAVRAAVPGAEGQVRRHRIIVLTAGWHDDLAAGTRAGANSNLSKHRR